MATKHMKRCLTSLAIKEMQTKSIVRYHCISICCCLDSKSCLCGYDSKGVA